VILPWTFLERLYKMSVFFFIFSLPLLFLSLSLFFFAPFFCFLEKGFGVIGQAGAASLGVVGVTGSLEKI